MMADDDALIELLNGFGSNNRLRNFDTEVFLDEDGMPTDRFLQALKSDMSMLPAFEEKDPNSSIYNESITHQLDREFSPNRRGGGNHRARYPPITSTSSREFKTDRIDQTDEFLDYHFSGDEPDNVPRNLLRGHAADSRRAPKTENLAASFKTLITDDPYFDNAKQRRKVQFNQDNSGKVKSPDGTKATSATKEETKPKKRKTPVTAKPAPKTPTYMSDHRTGTNQGTQGTCPGGTSEEIHFPRAVGIDTTEIEVEAEGRVKSLQLRLQGQLQTIRSLEAQLGDALQLLEARNKQLAHCNARLKASASTAAQNSSSNNAGANNQIGGGGGNLRSEATAAKATELAEQYKVQADFLQAKLTEEQARKQRAEERARVLKNYSEKAKERCLLLEGQNAELRGAITEMTTRMEKYRKSYKDIASESAAQKSELTTRDEESAKFKRQLEKTESAVRNLQMALEHSREELRTQKVETSAAQSRYKQLALQVEIQNERDATKRAEERLRGMESARKGPVNDSHHHQHSHTNTTAADAYATRSGSPPHPQQQQHQQHCSNATVTAEQQLQYLQHLAGVSSLKRQSPERHPYHHTAPNMNLGARFDQHMLDQPPPVPHYAQATGRAHAHNADLSRTHPAAHAVMQPHAGLHGPYNESVRSFIEHEEANLDRDVVIESLQALQGLHSVHPPAPVANSSSHRPQAHSQAPVMQDRPPRWRSPPNQHQKSHIVNSVLRNSFSDFDSGRSSTGASAEYSGYVTQSGGSSQSGAGAAGGPVYGRDAPKGASYASMSDSELEHSDRRHRSDSQHSERSTVSFIRQKVLDSGYSPMTAIGRSRSTSAGGSDANHSGIAQPARSSHVPSVHSHSAGIASSISDASTVNKVDASPSSAAAPSSGGKMPLNRLQALYDKVTNKTT